MGVPELSLADYTSGSHLSRSAFVARFFAGLQDFGFVVLRDHPIDASLLREAYALSAKLFGLSEDQKLRYGSVEAGQRGYTPFGREHAKHSPYPDLKEFWHVGRDLPATHHLKNFFPDNVWPSELPEFAPLFKTLFQTLDDTGRLLLEALTIPLEVKHDFFARMTESGSSILRLLHYPPLPAQVPEGWVRAAAHEDINLITLLPAASSSGLELLSTDGTWLAIDAAPDTLIVDSGDMLARLTNGVLPATTHRVINPSGPNVSRYSMPFFMHPNPDAWLKCLPSCRGEGAQYPDILANDFLLERLREIGLTKQKVSQEPIA